MSWLAIRSEKNFSCCISAPKYSFNYGEAFLMEGGVCARHYDFICCFLFFFPFSFDPGTCIGLETFLNILLQEVELCCTLAIDMQIK